jgi:hypothetical protein
MIGADLAPLELAGRLALAIGLAAFIGLAFEEVYKREDRSAPGGVRTFPMLALSGAMLYLIEPQQALAFVVGLIALAFWLHASLRNAPPGPNCNVVGRSCDQNSAGECRYGYGSQWQTAKLLSTRDEHLPCAKKGASAMVDKVSRKTIIRLWKPRSPHRRAHHRSYQLDLEVTRPTSAQLATACCLRLRRVHHH